MFGDTSVLDAADATRPSFHGERVALGQSSGSVAVDEKGTVAISQPARTRGEGLGSIAIIDEDVLDRIARALGFADRAWSEWTPSIASPTSFAWWRWSAPGTAPGGRAQSSRRARNSMPMNLQGADYVVVGTEPTRISRRALRSQRSRLAEDLVVRLRRATAAGRWVTSLQDAAAVWAGARWPDRGGRSAPGPARSGRCSAAPGSNGRPGASEIAASFRPRRRHPQERDARRAPPRGWP